MSTFSTTVLGNWSIIFFKMTVYFWLQYLNIIYTGEWSSMSAAGSSFFNIIEIELSIDLLCIFANIFYMSEVKNTSMEQWYRNMNTFFILSMGRSGTKFLASLIDSARPIGSIHEFYPDYLFYQAFFRSARLSDYYIKYLRMPYIYKKNSRRDIDTYGEVNSVLRRNAHSLKKFMPHAKILHLVRNPKDVVRSMMNRKTMRWYDGVTKFIRPPKDDMYYSKWPEMDRFERICWYWRSENEYIREYADRTVRFEDMLRDYDYFSDTISMITGHTIDKTVWMDKVKKPKNVSSSYSFPGYEEWDKAKKEAFRKICSKEMGIYGYEY